MLNQMQMSEIALARSLQNQYTYAPAQSPPTMFHQQQPMPQPMYVKFFGTSTPFYIYCVLRLHIKLVSASWTWKLKRPSKPGEFFFWGGATPNIDSIAFLYCNWDNLHEIERRLYNDYFCMKLSVLKTDFYVGFSGWR